MEARFAAGLFVWDAGKLMAILPGAAGLDTFQSTQTNHLGETS
jgi:hypothetical protein